MEVFDDYGTLCGMIKFYRPRDEYATSLLEVLDFFLELFSPETMSDPENVESVIL